MTKLSEEAIKHFEPVLVWLDAGAPHQTHVLSKTIRFNMNTFCEEDSMDFKYNHCGAAMCMAGAVREFSDNEKLQSAYDICSIADFLGMTKEDKDALFWGYDEDEEGDVNLNLVTAEQAATTLRHYLDTGDVVWGEDVQRNEE